MVAVPLPAVIGEVAATVDCAADTVPAFTTTVAVCVTATELMVADTVLVSAVVELSVPVATPLAFVGPPGCVNVLPGPGVAGRTAAPPWIGLPVAAFAPTGVGGGTPPAAVGERELIGDVAVTADCAAETVPGFTTTMAV